MVPNSLVRLPFLSNSRLKLPPTMSGTSMPSCCAAVCTVFSRVRNRSFTAAIASASSAEVVVFHFRPRKKLCCFTSVTDWLPVAPASDTLHCWLADSVL